ncbi:MAG TPA: DUF5979 domain-containing protein [Chthoniobacterales bacterium]|nr:DUF5979 domain-containing protein [Chthoniobacterales bacterium]
MKTNPSTRFPKTTRPRTNHQNFAALRRFRGVLFLLLLAALLALTGASSLAAATWNANQVLHGGNVSSSSGVPWDYDIQPSPLPPNPITIGSLGHIAYGIQDPAGNTTPVSLTITTPAGFHVTGGFCVRFFGPSNPPNNPTNLGSGCNLTPGASVHNIAVGVLNKNDKVIVIINGYFDQAGSQAATFAPSGPGTQPQNLNWSVYASNLPVDITLTKEEKPKTTGTFGSSATVPIWPTAGTVTYKLKVKNQSTPDLMYHTTDVYLGQLLRLNDTVSTPGGVQDVNLGINISNFQCTKSTGSVDCPGAISDSFGLGYNQPHNLPMITYPALSPGLLPAGEWFEITFDATITNGSQCSANNNNKLLNQAFLTFSNGTTTVQDTNASNNTSGIATTYLQLPGLPTTCAPIGTVNVSKTVQTVGSWTSGTPFIYAITVTNPSNSTLAGLTLTDWVGNNGTPPFTATPNNIACAPAVSCGAPTTYTPVVSSGSSGTLFSMPLTLGPNASVTIKYKVQYSAACASTSTAGAIWNYAYVGGPATGSAYVSNAMPSLPICQLQVTKVENPVSPPIASYPATLKYVLTYKNNSSGPITVRTLIDAMSLDSPLYATSMDITYSYTCANNGVSNVTSPLSYTSPSSGPNIQPRNPLWSGTRLIDFSNPTGMVFSAGASLTFNLTVTLNQPPTGDALCQNSGITNVVNTAFMDPSYPYNTNLSQVPAFFAKVTKALPKCVSIVVGKSGPTTAYGGGPVTFTLTVKNAGSDTSPAGMKLIDTMSSFVSPFANPFSITGAGGSGGFTGNVLNFTLAAIPGGGTTSFQVSATAPVVTQPTPLCNTADVRIAPGGTTPSYLPPLTFFEGNQTALTTAQACIQIVPPPPPTLVKKFSPAVISLGQPVDVVFTLTNAAGSPAQTGLSFADALPNPPFPSPGTTGTVTNTCGGTANVNFNVVGLHNGALPAGPSSCTVTYHMSPPTKCGIFHNTAENIHEPHGLDFSHLSADLEVKCKPTMEKSFSPAVINLGQPVNVVITLTNPPSSPAQTGLVFFDNLPSPPFTGGAVVSNTCGGSANVSTTGTISLTGGSLPPGPSSCSVTYTMKPPTKCGSFQNTAHNIEKSNLDFSHLAANLNVKCEEPVKGEIRKVAVGVPANYAGQFKFNVSCSPPGSGPVTSVDTVSFAISDPLQSYKGGTKAKIKTVGFGPFPPGTICTVTEVPPTPPGHCAWLAPVVSPANGNVTLTAPGPVTVTVLNQLSCGTGGGTVFDGAGPSTTLPDASVFSTPSPSPSPIVTATPPKDAPTPPRQTPTPSKDSATSPRPLPTRAAKSEVAAPAIKGVTSSASPTRNGPFRPSPTPTPAPGR